jgi:hypothetical protein
MDGEAVLSLAAFGAVCLLPIFFRFDWISLFFSACLLVSCFFMAILPIKPFAMCLAMGPVAIYLILLGAINLHRRPFLVSGLRDVAAIAIAVFGLAMAGPAELFFPLVASLRFGPFVWLMLAALYALCVALILLSLRPRLVVYNIAMEELRPVLGEVVAQLDSDARWAGDSLHLPKLGVQLHLESLGLLRNVSLVPNGPVQNHQGWRSLGQAMTAALGRLEVPRNTRAVALVAAGLLLAMFVGLTISHDPQAVAQAIYDAIQG